MVVDSNVHVVVDIMICGSWVMHPGQCLVTIDSVVTYFSGE